MAVIQPTAAVDVRRSGTHRSVRIARSAVTIIFGAIIGVNLGAVLSEKTTLVQSHIMAALVAAYLLVEARFYLRRSDAFSLVSPAFLAIIFHFAFAYLLGITTSFFFPWVMQRFEYWLPDLDGAVSGTLTLVAFAAFCMMRGYTLGQPLARKVRRSLQSSSLLRREMHPVFGVALAMQAAYVLIVAYAIQLGVFGMLSTAETRAPNLSVIQFVNVALAAGTLSYFLIMLRYFQRQKLGKASFVEVLLIGVMVIIHLSAGALSGFKGQIVFPFLIAGFAFFLATRRVPVRFAVFACAALLVGYAVIEPFRNYLGAQDTLPTSLAGAVESFGAAVEQREQLASQTDISSEEQISSRFDLTGMTALATNYVDFGDLTAEKREEFQNSILLAPVLAYIPRFIWSEKPTYSEGVWFNQAVRGNRGDRSTSVGMGPIGYLYMAGGVLAVAMGFLGLGILQALMFDGFARSGAGGLIIFLSTLNTLVQIPSSFGPALVGVLQMLPVAFVGQMILLRRTRARLPNLNEAQRA